MADIEVTPARTRTLRRALAAASGAALATGLLTALATLENPTVPYTIDVTAATAQDANITEIDSNLAITGPGVTVTRAG